MARSTGIVVPISSLARPVLRAGTPQDEQSVLELRILRQIVLHRTLSRRSLRKEARGSDKFQRRRLSRRLLRYNAMRRRRRRRRSKNPRRRRMRRSTTRKTENEMRGTYDKKKTAVLVSRIRLVVDEFLCGFPTSRKSLSPSDLWYIHRYSTRVFRYK